MRTVQEAAAGPPERTQRLLQLAFLLRVSGAQPQNTKVRAAGGSMSHMIIAALRSAFCHASLKALTLAVQGWAPQTSSSSTASRRLRGHPSARSSSSTARGPVNAPKLPAGAAAKEP